LNKDVAYKVGLSVKYIVSKHCQHQIPYSTVLEVNVTREKHSRVITEHWKAKCVDKLHKIKTYRLMNIAIPVNEK